MLRSRRLRRAGKVEIAKTMNRAGETLEKIAEFTGLSMVEVAKLRVRKK